MKKFFYLLSITTAVSAFSSDLEIYVGNNANVSPNVIFLLDDSGSMRGSRWASATSAINTTLAGLSNVNVGIAYLNRTNSKGSRIYVPVGPVATTRTPIAQSMRSGPGGGTPLGASFEAIYEYLAGREVNRNNTAYSAANRAPSPITNECQNTSVILFTDGGVNGGQLNDNRNRLFTEAGKTWSVSETRPFVIPSNGVSRNVALNTTSCFSNNKQFGCAEELADYMHRGMPSKSLGEVFTDANGKPVTLLNNFDVNNPKASSGIIRVNTIGDRTGLSPASITILENVAGMGGGTFIGTSNSKELGEAISQSLQAGASQNQSLVPPAISASSFNPLSFSDIAYIPVFEPSSDGAINWTGNLKKYRYVVEDGLRSLVGKNGTKLYSQSSGNITFNSKTSDFWATAADGADEVAKGGVRDKLQGKRSNQRKIFTVLPPTPSTYNASTKVLTKASINEKTLTAWDASNATLVREIVQRVRAGVIIGGETVVPPDASFTEARARDLIRWVRSGDTSPTQGNTPVKRDIFGAPIHAQPVVISTLRKQTINGKEANVVVIGTDRGVLHFFDGGEGGDATKAKSGGDELMAFIPPEMFAGLNQYIQNRSDIANKPMGFDGAISQFSRDGNRDGRLDGTDDRVLLLAGARRGADVIYAIELGVAADGKVNTGTTRVTVVDKALDGVYSKLGQTWSSPFIGRVQVPGETDVSKSKLVGIFSGGYDPSQDNYTEVANYTSDDVGNAVIMMDLTKGDVGTPLWYASNEAIARPLSTTAKFTKIDKMVHSIPAPITWWDSNGDGLNEKFFAVDIFGRVFRFDFDDTKNSANAIISSLGGDIVADLSTGLRNNVKKINKNDIKDQRRFFERPSVFAGSIPTSTNSKRVVKMALGSGYRAHPLTLTDISDTTHIQDRFYLLAFDGLRAKPSSYSPIIKQSNLFDNTKNLNIWTLDDATRKQREDEILDNFEKGNRGLFFDAEGTGEKFLSSASTVGGQILITSYEPPNPSANQCTLRLGNNFLYAFDATKYIPDPFWRIGTAPDASNSTDISKDFKTDKGRYPLPFPGLGTSANHTGSGFTGTGAPFATGMVGGVQIHRFNQPGDGNPVDRLMPRSYWQELTE
jgi:hypothetical protein